MPKKNKKRNSDFHGMAVKYPRNTSEYWISKQLLAVAKHLNQQQHVRLIKLSNLALHSSNQYNL